MSIFFVSFQVSAEMNRFKAAKLLVTEGAPAGVYDDHGNSALSLLIEKIPEVALIALDQLHTTDYINRREFYFLNYLEGAKLKEELQDTAARSPLEIAVQNRRFVMQNFRATGEWHYDFYILILTCYNSKLNVSR